MFCIVFSVRNATFILSFFKECCNFLCSFTTVCESGPYGFLVLSISVFVMFVLVGVSRA
jgi:hypothetical protein